MIPSLVTPDVATRSDDSVAGLGATRPTRRAV